MGDEFTNPPAFPSQAYGSDGLPMEAPSYGMTLRDWFAGQALGAIIKEMMTGRIGDHIDAGGGPSGFAASAFDIADAMLAARDAPIGGK